MFNNHNRLWFEFRQRYKDCNFLQSRFRELGKRKISNDRFMELCIWPTEMTDPKKWELDLLAKVFGTRSDKIMAWMNTFLMS